jgi:hypothetical protein
LLHATIPTPTFATSPSKALSAMVHDSDEALAVVVRVAESDPDRSVGKKAALAAPGRPISEGRRSKSGRLRRRPPATARVDVR